MNKILIILGITLLATERVSADELSDLLDLIDHRTKQIEKQRSENDELATEIIELDLKLAETEGVLEHADSLGAQKSTGFDRILELEKELEAKMEVLLALQSGFMEKLPFTKGETLGDFSDTRQRKYQNAVVTNIGPQGVTLKHSAGISRLIASDFPDGFRNNLIKRPASTLPNNFVAEIFNQRPSSVLKSAAFAGRRKEMAQNRSAQLNQTTSSVSEILANREQKAKDFIDWRKNRTSKELLAALRVKLDNQKIDIELKRLQARLDHATKLYNQNENTFQSETQNYQDLKNVNLSDLRNEKNRRDTVLNEFYVSRHELRTLVSKLEREILETQRRRKPEIEVSPEQWASLGEKRSEVESKLTTLEDYGKKLTDAYMKLYAMEDHKKREERAYGAGKIKSDKKKFEEKIGSYNAAIANQKKLISAMEKKIDEVEKSITL